MQSNVPGSLQELTINVSLGTRLLQTRSDSILESLAGTSASVVDIRRAAGHTSTDGKAHDLRRERAMINITQIDIRVTKSCIPNTG
jgi:hypothetical protein